MRLDAVARFLQDAAIDDVQETGWGMPDHLWFIRRITIRVEVPLLTDRSIDVVTWCSGVAAIAAGRRWILTGDRGGRIEVDSVWIHLDSDARPARLVDFGVYAAATAGRRVSTAIDLPPTPDDAASTPWPLRATDVDLHGHVNNAVHWQAVEDRLAAAGDDLRRPFEARLDYGEPIELGDSLLLAEWIEGERSFIAFDVDGRTKAVAVVG